MCCAGVITASLVAMDNEFRAEQTFKQVPAWVVVSAAGNPGCDYWHTCFHYYAGIATLMICALKACQGVLLGRYGAAQLTTGLLTLLQLEDIGARVFFEKQLTSSDVSASGRVVVPKVSNRKPPSTVAAEAVASLM